MRKYIGLFVLTTGMLGLVSQSANAQTFIPCPFDEVTGTIAERLPQGWSVVSTDQLTDTRVDERRGRDSLQCIYGDSVVLEVEGPRRELCTAEEGGFNCERRRGRGRGQGGRGPSVVADGALTIRGASPIDLDTGRLTRGPEADFRIKSEFPFGRELIPLNGARFARVNSNDPSPRDCRNANYGSNQNALSVAPGVNWTCYMTSDGRVGRFHVTGFAIFPVTLDIAYTTWE